MALSIEKSANKQRVGILVDLGNSETRVRVKYKPIRGLEGIHEPINTTFSLSNHYAGLVSSYEISPDYMNSASTIIDIDGIRIAHGDIVEREFVGSYEYPSGKNDKSAEPITNWSIQLIIIKVYHMLSEAWGIAISDIDIAFDIFCLLPPDEHAYNKQGMIDLIADIDSVIEYIPTGDDATYKTAEYPVTCSSIQCFPEGITAFFGSCVNINGNQVTPNKDVEKYMKGYVLIVDIGAGTTDLAIMQDGMLKADSRLSIPDAGNHIMAALQRNIKSNPLLRNQLKLGVKNVESVMHSAMICEGDGLINADCASALNDAKEELSDALAHQMATWVNSNSVVALVKGILVVGGANVAAVRDGEVVSPALETYLIPKIKRYCTLAELIDIRKRDPRYLNLDGLESIYLSFLSKRGGASA